MTDERMIAPPRAETPRLWTVAELAAAVARALSHDYAGAGSGRVTDVPGVRVIRWYQTIGLVDRPAEMRGRTALYGPRHLRQIVAIKRLQSAGQSLAEIQESLVGAPDEVLDRVARLPEGADGSNPVSATGMVDAAELVDAASLPVAVEVGAAEPDADGGHAAPESAEPSRGRFWASRAVAAPADRSPSKIAVSDAEVSDAATSDTATSAPVEPELSYGITLAPGVTVLAALPHPPTAAAVAAIRAAAAPLVAELAAHRRDGAVAPDSAPSPTALPANPEPANPEPAKPEPAEPEPSSAEPSSAAPPTTTDAPAVRGLTEGASS